jgi:hypothetical protein
MYPIFRRSYPKSEHFHSSGRFSGEGRLEQAAQLAPCSLSIRRVFITVCPVELGHVPSVELLHSYVRLQMETRAESFLRKLQVMS